MKAIIRWFADNPVGANLLMAMILVGGLLTGPSLRQEVVPTVEEDAATITVLYPGAAPVEVEQGVCMRIEEAVQGITGVDRVLAQADEGFGVVTVEFLEGFERQDVLDDIKSAVDRIDSFPDEAEDPVVSLITINQKVLSVAVWGNADELVLRGVADRTRDALMAEDGISLVTLSNARPYEVSIELSEESLQRYGLSFNEVVAAVRRSSLDLPGGSVKTDGGEVLLRSIGQAYRGPEFEQLLLRAETDGGRVLLGDVADVVDRFADTDQATRFNGTPAVLLDVFRVGEQDAIDIAAVCHSTLESLEDSLPGGLHLEVTGDDTLVLRDRLDMMYRNARMGLLLVLVSLALFLRMRLALWVTFGIPLSFLGAIWMLPGLDISINLISLFGFIVVLGIVVDDAIVVAENIHHHRSRGVPGLQAATEGTYEVAVPVTFAVLTTIASFSPMFFLPGVMGQFARNIPMVVVACLFFSLVEAMLVLPVHLRHLPSRAEGVTRRGWGRIQARVDAGLVWFRDRIYRRSLALCVRYRYATLALSLSVLLFTLGYFLSGRHKFNFFPSIEADNVAVELEMPLGTPATETATTIARFDEVARQLKAELRNKDGSAVIRSITTSVGSHPYREKQSAMGATSGESFRGAHLAEVNIELCSAEIRTVSGVEIAHQWQERTGSVAGAEQVFFNADMMGNEGDVHIQLAGPDLLELRAAADELQERALLFAGVTGTRDTFREGKRELKLKLLPEGESMGLRLADVARQVRQAFYGEEAQSVQRGRDEVDVMVRYPESERRAMASLENMRVRGPGGLEVPLRQIAAIESGRGYSAISRSDRERTIAVLVDLNKKVTSPGELIVALEQGPLVDLQASHPSIRISYEGRQRRQAMFMEQIGQKALLALIAIFVLLAIPLRSYLQPFIIMSAIPFGLVGAFWGHVFMGMDLAIFSIIGLTALSGVVVNDSLVMVDFINKACERGASPTEAILESGVRRFRPIMLTTLTTFAGLSPLLLEKSLQAKFIMPMAVSLGFGVVFATFITLVLVPSLYMILTDISGARPWLRGQRAANSASNG